MILNQQSEVRVDLNAARAFARRLRAELRLGRREFNVCFVNDQEIARLNRAYRGKPRPTDVLSFPWSEGSRSVARLSAPPELANFLGDVVISAQTARRSARAEGHSLETEISWLILHGVLHLLGYDHETDHGEMTVLELALRDRLGIADGTPGNRLGRRRRRRGATRAVARAGVEK